MAEEDRSDEDAISGEVDKEVVADESDIEPCLGSDIVMLGLGLRALQVSVLVGRMQ